MNTLFLGNGFSRSVNSKISSWEELFKDVDASNNKNKNYTFLYEQKYIKNQNITEEKLKRELVDDIEKKIKEAIEQKINVAEWFGVFLKKNKISNIITTNYDHGIEYILERSNYEKSTKMDNISTETTYSIRRCKHFSNQNINHEVTLWKIHGDIEAIRSVTLGFDQYCGSLAKLTSYVKGTYKPSKSSKITIGKVPIMEKCKDISLRDNSSWAELFFFSNIYIMGFGMDFSEIDIWWLLNKRMRIMLEDSSLIKNKIKYYILLKHDKKEEKKEIYNTLETFKVDLEEMDRNLELLEFMQNDFNT